MPVDNYETVLNLLMKAVQENMSDSSTECESPGDTIPVGVSNRHLPQLQEDLDALYGRGCARLNQGLVSAGTVCLHQGDLDHLRSQGAIEKVRVLGPVRSKTQVEILTGDGFKLGVTAPPSYPVIWRNPGVTGLRKPKGSVQMKEGLIVAQRHIHMTPADAVKYGVTDGQIVDMRWTAPEGHLQNVIVKGNRRIGAGVSYRYRRSKRYEPKLVIVD